MSVSSGSNSSSPIYTDDVNLTKFGTLIPNRIFVGGISQHTTEAELHMFFSNYGNVKTTKIVQDKAGAPKGYGFVTFETEEEAKRLQNYSEEIYFKDRKLNIAPAVKKQILSRFFSTSSCISCNDYTDLYNGYPYIYHNSFVIVPTQDYYDNLTFYTNAHHSILLSPKIVSSDYIEYVDEPQCDDCNCICSANLYSSHSPLCVCVFDDNFSPEDPQLAETCPYSYTHNSFLLYYSNAFHYFPIQYSNEIFPYHSIE